MSIASTLEWESGSAAATHDLGRRLGAACRGGECLLLTGSLGAGKTALVRGLAEGLGADPLRVKSPSFTLHHRHAGRIALNHLDLYFTESPEDLVRAGLRELLAAGEVGAVEWGERLPASLPEDRLEVTLEHAGPERRHLRLSPRGPRSRALLERAGLLPPPGEAEPAGPRGR